MVCSILEGSTRAARRGGGTTRPEGTSRRRGMVLGQRLGWEGLGGQRGSLPPAGIACGQRVAFDRGGGEITRHREGIPCHCAALLGGEGDPSAGWRLESFARREKISGVSVIADVGVGCARCGGREKRVRLTRREKARWAHDVVISYCFSRFSPRTRFG